MSFILSKFVWGLLAPATLLFLAIASAALLRNRKPRLSQGLLGSAVLFMALLLICPVGHWSLAPLEQRFPKPDLNTTPVDGIIVLGGVVDATASRRAGTTILNDRAERLTEFIALARRHPHAKLVFSGGSGSVRHDDREADYVRAFLTSQGFDTRRVIFENRSRNTLENAQQSRALAQPRADEHWLLITSAFHMPRAVGCFQRVGWSVIPYPVDYRSYSDDDWFSFDADTQLQQLSIAMRETIGLISYWLMGRIPAPFPAP